MNIVILNEPKAYLDKLTSGYDVHITKADLGKVKYYKQGMPPSFFVPGMPFGTIL